MLTSHLFQEIDTEELKRPLFYFLLVAPQLPEVTGTDVQQFVLVTYFHAKSSPCSEAMLQRTAPVSAPPCTVEAE